MNRFVRGSCHRVFRVIVALTDELVRIERSLDRVYFAGVDASAYNRFIT